MGFSSGVELGHLGDNPARLDLEDIYKRLPNIR